MCYSLEQWASIAQIAGAIAIPLSALALWIPLRQQTKLARVANAHVLTELASSLNLQLIQDEQVAKYWVEGPEEFDKYSQVEKFRYTSMLIWWLLLHENVFIQRQSELLDEKTYCAWREDLKKFLVDHRLQKHWESLKINLHPDFVAHVDVLLQYGV